MWLLEIQDSASEIEDEDHLYEMADSSVPVYTHERWQVFTDLGAYTEDLDELGGSSGDMTQDAGVALYLIALRMLVAIVEEAS